MATQTPRALSPLLAGALALAAGLLRLVPHVGNFAPIGGVGLFTGSRLRSWVAFALPLGVMILTNSVLWALRGPDYSPLHVSQLFVYPSIVLYAVIGRLVASTAAPWRIGLASVLGSLQFFLVTNLGTWLFGMDIFGDPYPKTVGGLLTCYGAALPFFQWTLLSDLGYAALLFGAHAVLLELATARQPAEATEPEA